MFTTTATIATDRASTYLQQLCKHIGHKVDVTFDSQSGHIKYPFGRCGLTAQVGTLDLTVMASTQADLTKTCGDVANHLERFAFRESPKIEWKPVVAT